MIHIRIIKIKMIPIAKPNLKGNEEKYVLDCIRTGWISSNGSYVTKFEKEFAKFSETKFATTTSSGTTALHLALLALGISEDDEVIVPNLTFATTANVVKYCNAKEILVDVDRETFNIDTNLIEDKITSKTKAIIVVHLYGFPCEMEKIMSIAKMHNLYVIEDAAEAHGAEFDGRKIGSIGDIGCFSFFGNKTITTGEGGMCISNNKELIDKINILKNHGMKKRGDYNHEVVGYNYRLTNIQSAIGLAQMEKIYKFLKRRDEIAKLYIDELKEIKEISFQKPYENSKQIYWMFSIVLDEDSKITVNDLIVKLEENEINTRRMFYPLNLMTPYRNNDEFPNSEFLYKNSLVLPTYFDLTDVEIKKICEVIKNSFK